MNNKIAILFLLISSGFTLACLPNLEPKGNSNQSSKSADITPTPKIDISDYDRELASMRVADFHYIHVLERKDGRKFTKEDRAFVRDRKHYAANRFTFINDDRILFIGSNYVFTNKNIDELKERFDFKDFSKPAEQIEREKEAARKEREGETEDSDENENTNN